MIFQAILSNKAHPEYGVATIPFPIPSDQYDHIIELLEAMSVGAATAQDCWVDELTSGYPILNLLAAQSVDLDELDYLASGWSVSARTRASGSKLWPPSGAASGSATTTQPITLRTAPLRSQFLKSWSAPMTPLGR